MLLTIRDFVEWYTKIGRSIDRTTKVSFIIFLTSEIADLMMVNSTFYQKAYISPAQKSKADGIHMYLATQRSSADIVTDMMSANIFGHLVIVVASENDSQRLLNNNDAAQISKQGQLIYFDLTTGTFTTVQAPYVSDATVVKIVVHIKGNLLTR